MATPPVRVTLSAGDLAPLQKELGPYRYIHQGEGEPYLVFLHGLFGSLSNFAPLVEYFSRCASVYVPLLPIYSMPLKEATVEGLVNYIHDFLAQLNLPPVVLIGNSLGGHIALLYALRYPEHTRALILTGSSGLYERTLGTEYPRRNDYQFIRERAQMTFYDPSFVTDELVQEVYEAVNNRESALRIISFSRSAMRSNLRHELPAIQQPVCLIWGRQDRITPPEVAEEFHQLLPNSELHFIDRCGHAPMMEQPDQFITIMEGFLRRQNLLHRPCSAKSTGNPQNV